MGTSERAYADRRHPVVKFLGFVGFLRDFSKLFFPSSPGGIF